MQLERVRVEVDRLEVGHLKLGAEAGRLLLDVLNEFRALNTVRKAGKVLDQRGDRELAAGLVALEDERIEAGASGVDGCGEPGASGAENYGVASVCHEVPVLILAPCGGLAPYSATARIIKMMFMANLTLIYGLRLLPGGRGHRDS